MKYKFLLFPLFLGTSVMAFAQHGKAPAPMYRDPITDGAADPARP